jgi:hypothetical protein
MTDEDELPPTFCAMSCLLGRGMRRVRFPGGAVVPRRGVAGRSGQQMPEVRERLSTGGAQATVVPALDETLRQDRLEEASDALLCGKRAALPLVGFALLEAKGDAPVIELFDAVVGESNAPDRGGEVGDALVAASGWFTVGAPWLAPEVGGQVSDEVGLGKVVSDLAPEECREGWHGHQPIRLAG